MRIIRADGTTQRHLLLDNLTPDPLYGDVLDINSSIRKFLGLNVLSST